MSRDLSHNIFSGSFLPVLAVTSLGVSSVITQITLTRELLNIFQGNEIVIGLLMSTWLVLTGAGTWAGRFQRRPQSWLSPALLAVALLPFAHLLLLRMGRDILALPGEVPHPLTVWALLLVVLAPYCLLSGYLLPLACALLGKGKTALNIGRVYAVDSIGDIAGGAIYSFGLVTIATNFSSLFLPGCANLCVAILLSLKSRQWGVSALATGLFPVLATLHFGGADRLSLNRLYPAQTVLQAEETPYGRIVVTHQAEQVNFFENGIPFSFSQSEEDAEISVHLSLSQLPHKPLSVLVISGGLSGMLKEIMLYPLTRIHYLELDPAMARLCLQYVPECSSPLVRIQTADGRKYLDTASMQYDAVLLNLPPPANMQINRFYTLEFFQALKSRLVPGGVAAFTLPGVENYYPRPLAELYRTVYSTAKRVFKNVKAYPLEGTRFLMSDSHLTWHVAQRLKAREISTDYLAPIHLKAGLTPDRISQLEGILEKPGSINRDLDPVALKFQHRYWLMFHRLKWKVLTVLLALAMLAGLMRTGPVEAVIWTSGFSAMALEFILLMLIQIQAGCLYKNYSLMITLFMAGLFTGSAVTTQLMEKFPPGEAGTKTPLFLLEIGMTAVIFTLAACVAWTDAWKNNMLLNMVLFVTACIAGAQFPGAALAQANKTPALASRLYTADFLGAAAGTATCAVFLVPVLGVKATLLTLLGLKTLSLLNLLVRK